jgi:competence protein ComEA
MPLSWWESLRERRSPAMIALVAVLAVVLVAGLTAWYALRQSPEPLFGGLMGRKGGVQTDGASGAGDQATGEGDGGTASEPPAQLSVHVAGAVVTPGVYMLAEGQRAIDAIRAAGGPKKEAAIDSLNLAQLLADGQRLYVPTQREVKGAPAGAVYSGNKPFVPPGGDGGGATTGPRVINVNTATQAELESVPGIGPVLAGRIITWRTANGPFQALSDLTKVSGIGEKKLQDMQPYLTLK